MAAPKQPTKEEVRHWLNREVEQRRPPQTPEQIRRELGWHLTTVNKVK